MDEGDADAADVVVRRAPFSVNPRVGVRGQRTQQRILEAALDVFGNVGYHQAHIDAIAKGAGCSRVSFYQYFSSKEDVFRHLAAEVARQLNESTRLLQPITPDGRGWDSLRGWVDRYADIHDRYQPVFRVFPDAAATDAGLADDSTRTAQRHLAGIQSRVAFPAGPHRGVDAVIELLRECLGRTLEDVGTLRTVAPRAFPKDDILDAYTDVLHRSLFGFMPDVNVHGRPRRESAKLPFGPLMYAAIGEMPDVRGPDGTGAAHLVEAARDLFVTRGYHGTRVDDIVEAAGVSHGAFYSHFKNKDELAHVLAAQAMRSVSSTFMAISEIATGTGMDRAALRRWLRDYNRAYAREMAMIRVWADAALEDDTLAGDSAAALDWGRRRMAHFLEPRGFGDAETEAVVLLSLVDTFGVREPSGRMLDATLHVIERGFLGR